MAKWHIRKVRDVRISGLFSRNLSVFYYMAIMIWGMSNTYKVKILHRHHLKGWHLQYDWWKYFLEVLPLSGQPYNFSKYSVMLCKHGVLQTVLIHICITSTNFFINVEPGLQCNTHKLVPNPQVRKYQARIPKWYHVNLDTLSQSNCSS